MTPEVNGLALETVCCTLCGSEHHSDIVATGSDFEYETSPVEFSFVSCSKCGHVYLNPRPTIESAPVIYPKNYYAVAGAHKKQAWSVLGRVKDTVVGRRIEKLVMDLPPDSSILEAGCGDGSLLMALRKRRPDLRLSGLDLQISDDTRRRMSALGIDAMEGALEDARPDRRFDMVVMNQVIEHLWHPRKGLLKANALLRPRGVLSISTPNLDGYDRRLFKARAWGGYHFPRHLNLFTSESLRRLVEECGFQPLRVVNLTAPLVWTASIHNYLTVKHWPGRWIFRDSNLLALGLATAVDIIASHLGKITSNQQMIAEKVREVEVDLGRR